MECLHAGPSGLVVPAEAQIRVKRDLRPFYSCYLFLWEIIEPFLTLPVRVMASVNRPINRDVMGG